MKKKNLLVLIIVFLLSFFSLCLISCDTNNTDNTDNETNTNDTSTSHTCVYSEKITSDTYKVSNATCTEKAKYYFSCTCGKKGTETFEYGTELGHDFINYVYNNDATCKQNGTKTAFCIRNCGESSTITNENTILSCSVDEFGFCTFCDAPITPTSGIIYGLSEDEEYAEVLGYEGNSTKLNIADTYLDKPVKVIYRNAFKENYNIEKIVIPDSVAEIQGSSFYRCDHLKTVIFGKNLETIGNAAFFECYSLTDIVLPEKLKTIDEIAFCRCSVLKELIIPSSVDVIGDDAFSHCTNLTKLTILEGVDKIEPGAFSHCLDLLEVEIYAKKIFVEDYVFSGCPELQYNIFNGLKYLGNKNNPYLLLVGVTNVNYEKIEIHENTMIVASGAFYECSRLNSVRMNRKITYIGEHIFYRNLGVVEILFGGTKNEWESISKQIYWSFYPGEDGTVQITYVDNIE